MCDHYNNYFPEDAKRREENAKRQIEYLKPIKYSRSLGEINQELTTLRNRIKQLEKELGSILINKH